MATSASSTKKAKPKAAAPAKEPETHSEPRALPDGYRGPDHAQMARDYIAGVIAGTIPAGPYVIKAAQRHLRDLERAKNDASYKYYFDDQAGAKVCRFIEKLPHTKGEWARNKELIVLQGWQCFLIITLFGWKKKKNHKRRFRVAYWEIPRKNGKSILGAGIGNYMLVADGEFGAEVYSGATTEKQAWEVFKPAKLMWERTPRLQQYFTVDIWSKVLVVNNKGSKFEPLIGNPGDGASPSCAIVDEYHEHDTPALYNTMETGMGARTQPLMLVITTAGYNLASPCHEKHDELVKVLDEIVENDELFGCIFGIGEKDDWADPKILIKANPNFGISVDEDFLLSQQRQAVLNPIDQNKFKTKHLNVWCAVYNSMFNMQQWLLATDNMLLEDELIGDKNVERCIAVDLASKVDFCTEQRIYKKVLGGKNHYYIFGSYWLPEDTIEEAGPNHAHYVNWVKQGKLIQTDGATVDFETITKQIVSDAKRIQASEIVYDPFNATQMAQDLLAAGYKNVVEFLQQPQNFALPIDELQSAMKDGRVHHDGNPITAWCMANVVARPTKKGLSAPMKMKPHQKIDGAVAIMMGVARLTAVKEKKEYRSFSLG